MIKKSKFRKQKIVYRPEKGHIYFIAEFIIFYFSRVLEQKSKKNKLYKIQFNDDKTEMTVFFKSSIKIRKNLADAVRKVDTEVETWTFKDIKNFYYQTSKELDWCLAEEKY